MLLLNVKFEFPDKAFEPSPKPTCVAKRLPLDGSLTIQGFDPVVPGIQSGFKVAPGAYPPQELPHKQLHHNQESQ
jgi:hypothetical protein